ncbi:amino acid adenylation domain-containing protein [Actinomycetes bacterium M1A6_2h]
MGLREVTSTKKFPLSAAQQDIWTAQRVFPSIPFVVSHVLEVEGRLEPQLLIAAADIASRQLESPGLRIEEQNGRPKQWVDFDAPYALELRDFRGVEEPMATARDHIRSHEQRPIDMSRDPLVVSEILRIGDEHWIWYSRAHHVAIDGLGGMALVRRTAEVYTALLNGTRPPRTRALGVRELFDYESNYLATARYARDRDFWAARLAALPASTGTVDTLVAAHVSESVGLDVPSAVAEAMIRYSAYRQCSAASIILAAFALRTRREKQLPTVVLSLPVSGRVTKALRESAGMVSAVAPLRIDFEPISTVAELIRSVEIELTGVLRHRRTPVEASAAATDGPRRESFGPVVNIMMQDNRIQLGGVEARYRILSSGPIDDLTVNVYAVAGNDLRIDFVGHPDRYTKSELQRCADDFLEQLHWILDGADDALLDHTAEPPAGMAAVVLPERIPLSEGQRRLWAINQMDTTSGAHNFAVAVRLGSNTDAAVLVDAFRDVIGRHEVLRTYYPNGEAGPHQVVRPSDTVLTGLRAESIRSSDVGSAVESAASSWFDVARVVPLKVRLFALTTGEMLMVVVVHRINADIFSIGPLRRDLATAYAARLEGRPPEWEPLPVSYAQYAVWSHQQLVENSRSTERFWSNTLREYGTHAVLPSDRSRPAASTRVADEVEITTDSTTWRKVQELASDAGATPFMVVHGVLALILTRIGGDCRTVIDTVCAGREEQGLGDLIGSFVRTVPLAVTVDESRTFRELVALIRDVDSEALSHPADGLSASELLIEYRATHDSESSDPAAPFVATQVDSHTSDYDLHVQFLVDGHEVAARLRYALDMYDRETAAAFADLIGRALSAVTAEPGVALDVIELAQTDKPVEREPMTHTLLDVFKDRGGIAIVDELGTTPYVDLDGRASRLARVLLDRGVTAETVVALSLPRSTDYVVALWAVVKAGAAFMPVDPGHPPARRRVMLRDVSFGIGTGPEREVQWIDPSTGRALPPYLLTDADRQHPVRPENAAYVMYTSGSTGEPRPVVVTHGSAAELARVLPARYGVTRQSRVLHGYSPNFDAAMLEIVLAFATGATLVVAPPELVGGEPMGRFLTEHSVTHFLSTPAVLATVPPVGCVHTVAVGGDMLPHTVIGTWAPGRTMLNAYGLSEATVVSTLTGPLGAGPTETIGRPIESVDVTVLDHRLRPVPVGGIGELYLAGPMLARGYDAASRASAERFVAAPGGRRMFRTGDRVRQRHDGQLVFIGRNDFQVKILGQRVELGEVEAVLRGHPGVAGAVADVRGGRLVAWVSGTIDSDEARAWQMDRLPGWAVASTVVVLDRIPMTPSGKLDRDALTDNGTDVATADEPARVVGEDVVRSIFADALGVDSVDKGDNFFDRGGHSLAAAMVGSRLGVVLGITVPVRLVYDFPTPRSLARAVSTLSGAQFPLVPVTHRNTPGPMPLSSSESRMWIRNRVYPQSAAEHVVFRIDVPRSTDLADLRAAVIDVVDRHRPLRTVYPTQEFEPVAIDVTAHVAVPLIRPRFVAASELDAVVQEISTHPIDLRRDVPIRLALLDSTSMTGALDDEYLLVVVVHRIAADREAMIPFASDVEIAYAARSIGREPAFAALEVDYGDYRRWQREGEKASGLDFWTRTLRGLPLRLELPTGSSLSMDTDSPVGFRVDGATRAALASFADSCKASRFVVLHAALALLLAQLAGTTDVVIGTRVSTRLDPNLAPLVGAFVEHLILRTDVDPSTSWLDFVTHVRDRDFDAFTHRDVPFDRVVDAVRLAGSTDARPFCRVLLTLEDAKAPALRLGEYDVEAREVDEDESEFDLEFVLVDSDDGIDGTLRYSPAVFARTVVESMSERFARVLRTVAAHPTVTVGDIDTTTSAERRLGRVDDGMSTATPLTLGELLRSAVGLSPHSPAVVGEQRMLTYAQLDMLSDRLSRRLIEYGAGPGRLVAIALPRSVEFVVAMWAAAKSGSGFFPIDPTSSLDLITDMLARVGPVVGITDVLNLPNIGVDGTWVDYGSALPDSGPRTDDAHANSTYYSPPHLDDTAYVVPVSDPTERWKGVRVTHRGLADLVAAQRRYFGVTGQARVLQFASPCVDGAVFEMLLAFGSGAALVVAGTDVGPGVDLGQFIEQHRVTHVYLTPTVLQRMSPAHVPSVHTVIMFGERNNTTLVGRWSYPKRLHNSYGVTELSMMASCSRALEPGSPGNVGMPIEGVEAMVLDSRLRRVPSGVAGELYLAGSALAEGYVSMPGATAERFVPHVMGEPGARMFRTGDAVRWNDNGGLEFLGRVHSVVDTHGVRVDPAAVEAAMLRHPGIEQVSVTSHRSPRGDHVLEAHTVGTATPSQVWSWSVQLLPHNMIPAAVTSVSSIPTTVSQKVDASSLPSPSYGAPSYRAPATPTEHVVAAIMGRVLRVDYTTRVGADDNFFELGGNSLAAVGVMDSLSETFGRVLPVLWLFGEPTVSGLAARIDADGATSKSVLPIRPYGTLPPLWCLCSNSAVAQGSRPLVSSVPRDRPIFGIRTPDRADVGAASASIGDIASLYASEMRKVQPEGPFHLIGWSFGAVVAHAVAARLEQSGHRVAVLAIADPIDPSEFELPVVNTDVDFFLTRTSSVPDEWTSAVRGSVASHRIDLLDEDPDGVDPVATVGRYVDSLLDARSYGARG